jgi:hypothetical protein
MGKDHRQLWGTGGHLGQGDVDEPAQGQHALRGDGLGQLGHHLTAYRVHVGALAGGKPDEFGVAGLRRGRHEQLRHHAASGQRLTHRLGPLCQERPGSLPEGPLGELARCLDPR